MKPSPSTSARRLIATAACSGLLLAGSAWGALSNGVNVVDNYVNDPEFFLVVQDGTNKASYILDLGLKASTLFDVGRSDAGHQQFWTLDRNLDPRLDKLLDLGAPVSSLNWAVFAVDYEGYSGQAGQLYVFTTLQHTTPTGTVNPTYASLLSRASGDVEQTAIALFTYVEELNGQTSNPDNLIGALAPGQTPESFAYNGSAFAAEGSIGYADSAFSPIMSVITSNFNTPPGNAVGRSSWAYYVTQGGDFDTFAPAIVDEFDNTEHDAYWGMAEDPATGILYLSFTLEAAGMTAAERAFTASIGRTEFGGSFAVRALPGIAVASTLERPTGYARMIGGAFGDATVQQAVALPPVPEPATWGLMTLGLLATAAAARRRRA